MTAASIKTQILQLDKAELAEIVDFVNALSTNPPTKTTTPTKKTLKEERKKAGEAFLQKHGLRPMQNTISLEQVKKEQNWKPMDKNEFFRRARKIGIEESIEDLLKMLD